VITRVTPDCARRNTDRNTVRRHIFEHHGVGANSDVVADRNRTEDFRTCPNVHSVSDYWCSGYPGAAETYRYTIAEDHIITEERIAADDYSTEVLDLEASPDSYFARQIDSSEYLTEYLQYLVDEG
jgi:hypothetical protein